MSVTRAPQPIKTSKLIFRAKNFLYFFFFLFSSSFHSEFYLTLTVGVSLRQTHCRIWSRQTRKGKAVPELYVRESNQSVRN